MARKLKRPDGEVREEYITVSTHVFEDGKLAYHHNPGGGSYTGRFCFRFLNGKTTDWYRAESAPKWLHALYLEATGEDA